MSQAEQAKVLELEHEDVKDIRNAILAAEWGIPIALVVSAIQIGWLNTVPNFLFMGFSAFVFYRLIHGVRVEYDEKLKKKRDEITKLLTAVPHSEGT